MGNVVFKRILIVALILFFSPCITLAKNKKDKTPPTVANSQEHQVLSLEATEVLTQMNDPSSMPDISKIYLFAEYNNPEIINITLNRLLYELSSSIPNKDLIEHILFLYAHMLKIPEHMSSKYMKRYYDLSPFFAREAEFLNSLKISQRLYQEQTEVDQNIQRLTDLVLSSYELAREDKLLFDSLPRAPVPVQLEGPLPEEEVKPEFVPAQQILKKFRKHLEENVIEQKEVVDALYDFEFESLVKGTGNGNTPVVLYLMGGPGLGKDTSTEVYVDSIYAESIGEVVGEDHLFRVETQKSVADAWTLFGSGTGYVGSNNISPFIRFLVKHSAGKYILVGSRSGGGGATQEVHLNPKWKPGEIYRDERGKDVYFEPESAVIFLNEFHHWSLEAKDVVLKQALEKGIFKINNPGGGVSYIQVPGRIRIIMASNEGIGLTANRDEDGHRFGKTLSYEEMMERYNKHAHDKVLLKETVAKTSTRNAPGTPKSEQTGVSEAILSRIPMNSLILMKPISPEGLQKIVRLKIKKLNKEFESAEFGIFGKFQIRPTEELVKFIQEYDYAAEEGARVINDKVRGLLETPLYQAMKEADFTPEDVAGYLKLDIKKNEDRTYSLVVSNVLTGKFLREQVIQQTLKEKEKEPISDAKIKELAGLEDKLNDKVFGAKKASQMLAKAILLSEESRHVRRTKWDEHERATSFAFLGPSSTGKSEMVKALVKVLYPEEGEARRVDIDCNKIKSDEDMKTYIWGRKMGRDDQASEFMRKYDQFNGNMVLVLEESSNIPKEVLKSLYDLFREHHPKFSDGKERPMTHVTIVLTGNAGIEWYSQVPKEVPIRVQMAAWARIYNQSMNDPEYQRSTLEKYYPEPLINRIGQTNIVWFAPHTFQSIRELTLLKLAEGLSSLKANGSRRGWDIGFRNEEEKNEFVYTVEREAFYLHEQGASIDRYVSEQVVSGLRHLLLVNQVPSGSKVVLNTKQNQSDLVIAKQGGIVFDVGVENSNVEYELKAFAQTRVPEAAQDPSDIISTAAHEAGHEIVGRVLLGDKYVSDFITIIPGVVKIQDQWIYYLGLASKQEVEKLQINYEAGIHLIAQLMAGFEGERAISVGRRHSIGKSNDIQRAQQIAEMMVVSWGLVPEWGYSGEDLSKMSEGRKRLKERLVTKILEEGRVLAEQTLKANQSTHFEMTRRLSRMGEIRKAGLEEVYKDVPVNKDIDAIKKISLADGSKQAAGSHRIELIPDVNLPVEELANINNLIDIERQNEIAKARVVKPLPIFSNFNTGKNSRAMSCAKYFH